MKDRNKSKIYSFIVFAAITGGAIFAPQTTFADSSIIIDVNTSISGVQSRCYIVGGGSSDTTCPSTYGTFDASSNTLTLGTGLNDVDSSVTIHDNPDGIVTIKSTGDIISSFAAGLTSGMGDSNSIVFDLGNYTFTDKGSTVNEAREGTFLYSNFDNANITFNSGTVNLRYFSCNSIVMNGGTLTLAEDTYNLTGLWTYNLTMNGGKIIVDTTGENSFTVRENFIMNDGFISISSAEGDGLSLAGNAVVNGGTINLKTSSSDVTFGFGSSSAIFNGGSITIDGYAVGIASSDQAGLYFNGGNITIKNASIYAVYATVEGDIYDLIHFTNDTKINGGESVVYDTEHSFAAIGGGSIMTITNQEDFVDDDDSDGNDDANNDVRSPDTGFGAISDGGSASQSPVLAIFTGIAITCCVFYRLKARQ